MNDRPAPAIAAAFVAGLLASVAAAARSPQGEANAALDAAFARAMPPVEEARWTLVPWRRSLGDALAEAGRTRRPVFLYVNDGDTDSGRC
jgi:hypothetical protein